jgi:limonene-1,2-epoxide hydrolase
MESFWSKLKAHMSEMVLTLQQPTADRIKDLYAAFNARDIETCLCDLQPNVEWPNGMEGGTVCGHDGVRAYWTRQWGMINPHVDPVKIEADGHGRVVVDVHQVIKELDGKVLLDRMVEHVYALDGGLVRGMEIRE